LQASLRALKNADADALFIADDATAQSYASMIIEAARKRKLPVVFNDRSLVAEGGLASYGVSYYAMGRLAAKYVRQVLLGASPADLPVERSERFELVLNAGTAREIGVTIPHSLLLRADEVIQ
jgi:putative ABC transport system substrate-binding protein